MAITEEVIINWLKAKNKLKFYKESEKELRISICKEVLDQKLKGTKKLTIDGKYIVKATAKTNKAIDEGVLTTIWDELDGIEKNCIKYKPSIVASNYKLLPENSALNRAITEKPGLSSLSIEPLKIEGKK